MAKEQDSGPVEQWPQEEIPNECHLFLRVHKNNMREDGLPTAGAFRNIPKGVGGMSTDWDRYSDAWQTRLRARSPQDNAVLSLNAGDVRKVPNQRVQHTPDTARENRAHTDVFGPKGPEERLLLTRLARMVIPQPTPVKEA